MMGLSVLRCDLKFTCRRRRRPPAAVAGSAAALPVARPPRVSTQYWQSGSVKPEPRPGVTSLKPCRLRWYQAPTKGPHGFAFMFLVAAHWHPASEGLASYSSSKFKSS
jgi:hypothetical protein